MTNQTPRRCRDNAVYSDHDCARPPVGTVGAQPSPWTRRGLAWPERGLNAGSAACRCCQRLGMQSERKDHRESRGADQVTLLSARDKHDVVGDVEWNVNLCGALEPAA